MIAAVGTPAKTEGLAFGPDDKDGEAKLPHCGSQTTTISYRRWPIPTATRFRIQINSSCWVSAILTLEDRNLFPSNSEPLIKSGWKTKSTEVTHRIHSLCQFSRQGSHVRRVKNGHMLSGDVNDLQIGADQIGPAHRRIGFTPRLFRGPK